MAVQGFKYTLSWETDFRTVDAAPAGFSDRAAQTKATANLDLKLTARRDAKDSEYYFAPETVNVIIKAVKAESWVVSDKISDKLLKHEQLHYNISALGGRDLERKVLEMRDSDGKKLIAKKNALGTEIQALITQINKDYDAANLGTNHGQKDAQQSNWELHINNLMNDATAELKGI